MWCQESHKAAMTVNETALTTQIFDQLRRAMAGDPAGFTELYRDYLADAWDALRYLQEAVKQEQAGEIRSRAHQIKGSSMVLGAPAVAQCASTLEDMGRNADVEGAALMLERTKAALLEVQTELSARLGAGVVPANETAA
jgi:HPt (histidine-containing phosphotransfer) domain-containing protein